MNSNMFMTNLTRIWDSGEVLPWDLVKIDDTVEFLQAFKERTGSSRVMRLRWKYGSHTVECRYPSQPLPDRSGVVLCDDAHCEGCGCKYFTVMNADGTNRCHVNIPVVNEYSRPELGFLELPSESLSDGITFGVRGNDGYLDYIFDFDWQTGKLLQAVDAPHMRY